MGRKKARSCVLSDETETMTPVKNKGKGGNHLIHLMDRWKIRSREQLAVAMLNLRAQHSERHGASVGGGGQESGMMTMDVSPCETDTRT
jgi:hypothetical protein